MLAGMATRPDRDEAAPYYFTYIDQVGDGDICDLLDAQGADAGPVEHDRRRAVAHRYAPDKWTIREVVGHGTTPERLFVFRALWFARGFDSPLPSFDQHVAVASSGAQQRSWSSHIEEHRALRAATSAFFGTRPMPGRDTASQATTRSRFARWRT